ncbi:MAG TPA: hypothetical protein VHW09_24490 [Bryobacteraceae bacterium]|jgi:uncharacterized protein (TIGR03437 family)|nr:hypothetical protein [Bryobacteraceae bacterium]
MSITRYSKLLLVVLALALWAGTASAQTIATDTAIVTFSYTNGAVTAAQSAAITDSGMNSYTNNIAYNLASGAHQWLVLTEGSGTTPDTLGVAVDPTVTAVMAPGSAYSATVTLTDSNDSSTAVITVNLTVNSPFTGTAAVNALLSFVKTGGASQASATTTVTVTNSDSAYDTYTTVVAGACPSWLDIASANTKQAKSSASDTLTLSINAVGGAAATPTSVSGCTVKLQYLGVTFKTVTLTTLAIVSQPLISSAAAVPLTYTKGGGGTNSGTTNISVATGTANTTYAVDVASVPLWLTVTPASLTATTAGVSVGFAVNTAVAAGMATGNYSAHVGFFAAGFSDLLVPITFSISNTAPSVGLKEGTTEVDSIWSYGTAVPAPTVTPYSTNEPLPFTATCAVVVTSSTTYTPTATSCLLNGSQATALAPLAGVAYTWGYGLTVSFDSAIFALPIGSTAKVTVTVVPQGSATVSLAYKYTFQPIAPTLTSLSPATVAQIAHNTSIVILLKGANFVGPQNIANATVVPTQVWLGSSATALPQASVVVLSPTQMMVTIPQASFPSYPSGKTATTLAVGLANQIGATAPTVPQVSVNLNVTAAPVVYAVTSTATYVQPAIGSNPGLAPYELISIFGDNFGYASLNPNFNTATLNSYNQIPTALLVSGSGKTAVNLSVAFKDGKNTFAAPILFANQNQINAIVPSGVTVSDTVSIAVASGAAVSDGTFQATVVQADPGVFTLASDGTGQGAILNHDYTVNTASNRESIGHFVQIYMTGLGAPDSTAPDVASQTPASFPGSCSAISLAGATTPGYLQVVNTKVTGTGYVPPTPAWTAIDGAVIQSSMLKTNIFAPCMIDNVTVTFDPYGTPKTADVTGGGVLWAGFASGSVAGLYQVNVTIPTGTTTGSAVPVTVTINGHTSPAVTMAIQ